MEPLISALISWSAERTLGFPGTEQFWDMILFAFWWELAIVVAGIPILIVVGVLTYILEVLDSTP